MNCDNCKDDMGIVVSQMDDHFLHECTECGWCHRVHRMSADSYGYPPEAEGSDYYRCGLGSAV